LHALRVETAIARILKDTSMRSALRFQKTLKVCGKRYGILMLHKIQRSLSRGSAVDRTALSTKRFPTTTRRISTGMATGST
jgi:hypothetical protein